MASLVARDIQVAAAYEERHREALRFSGLYELAGNLLTGMSEEELIEKSFSLARELFAPDALGFARLTNSGEGIVKRYEPGKDFEKDYRFDAERSLVAMAAKHKGFLNHRDMSKPVYSPKAGSTIQGMIISSMKPWPCHSNREEPSE